MRYCDTIDFLLLKNKNCGIKIVEIYLYATHKWRQVLISTE